MSIVISGIRIPYRDDDSQAIAAALKRCSLGGGDCTVKIIKKSLDLRHGKLAKVFSVLIDSEREAGILAGNKDPQIRRKSPPLETKITGSVPLEHRPVVVGLGPAGLFAALMLAEKGYRPAVIELGAPMEERDRDTERFVRTGHLNTKSNIQFGEGGAGAYSDGKLTTRINDPRCELVLEKFMEFGAPSEIAMAAKPHVGTDLLKNIVVSMRRRIEELGGTVAFYTQLENFRSADGRLLAVKTDHGEIPCETAVLAVGHSARTLFETLKKERFTLVRKPFSVGVRAEHLQQEIDWGVYGKYAQRLPLPPAEYALSRREGERACYSFCMCPGGEVVAAASEEGEVVTNGMSYHARGGRNANAALAVSVLPQDFDGEDPLAGMYFQRELEKRAFQLGGGAYAAPVQRLGDFMEHRVGSAFGTVTPTYPRGTNCIDLHELLPPSVSGMLERSLPCFGKQIPGYDTPDCVFTAIETRTSSPVRLMRGEDLMSVDVFGLIPCGEGAGYAGGIMSAAVDGIRAAETIMARWMPPEEK